MVEIKKNDGQSLVELVVGLLAVVLVLMGLLQIGRISLEHTQTLLDARKEADELAMDISFDPVDPGLPYAWGVAPGEDQRSYSLDDVVLHGSPDVIIEDVVAHASPDELNDWIGENELEPMRYPGSFTEAFDLTSAQGSSGTIELYPIIRNLVSDDDRIRLTREVWMPWLRGVQ